MGHEGMSLVELVREGAKVRLTDEEGEPISIELLPGLTPAEIEELEGTLPCPLPAEVRELLELCGGVDGVGAEVDFSRLRGTNVLHDLFPHGLAIASDGFGNFWTVDLWPSSQEWGPIYFHCHDPPMILLQSPSLRHFLGALFEPCQPGNAIDDVHEDRLFEVWRKNPGALSHAECLASSDEALRAFARELPPAFEIIDLRNAEIGFGFSWKHMHKTAVRRAGELPIFAYAHVRDLKESEKLPGERSTHRVQVGRPFK